jgi:hypothetical protein
MKGSLLKFCLFFSLCLCTIKSDEAKIEINSSEETMNDFRIKFFEESIKENNYYKSSMKFTITAKLCLAHNTTEIQNKCFDKYVNYNQYWVC